MVDGPVSSRRFSRRQIRNVLMVGGGVIVALVVVVGGWYAYNAINILSIEKSEKQLEEFASEQADRIIAPFGRLGDQLQALAKDPAMLALFKPANEDKLAAAANKQIGRFDSALKLRFILPDTNALDNESVPPLSYGSLDLLKRAQSTATHIATEAHLLGSPNEHIVMLKRVKNDAAELVGFMHLSLDVKLFESVIALLDQRDAYLELQQAGFGKAQVLGKHGDEAMREGEAVVFPIEGTHWRVAVWSAGAGIGGGSMPLLYIVVVVILLGVGLAVAVVLKRPKGESEGDSSEIVYAGAVKAIMDGAHPGMEKMVPHLPASDVNVVSTAPVSQGEVSDDIAMMIKAEDLKAAAAAETEMLDLTLPEAPPAQTSAAEIPAATATPAAASTVARGLAVPGVTSSDDGDLSAEIFRAYDIRGVVGKNLNEDIVKKIGQAIGSEAAAKRQASIVVGRDGRNSSPALAQALITGLRNAGRDVIDVGVVPTPVLYFAAHFLEVNSGVMLTGSHNGPEYNGLKIVLDGETLAEDGIQSIYNRIKENNYENGEGTLQTKEIIADYIRRISEDIPVAFGASFKIVVDCGNGVAGAVAPQLLRALGHDVVELYCDLDGNFPNHQPDPSQPENMQDIIDKVKAEEADLGFAFDGDGDRLGVVDDLGKIIWPDRQLMVLAKDVLSRNEGSPIIFDVKCSRYLKAIIESNGGKPLMWKTGHSLIKKKMKEVDAPLAGEMSGHIFFKERWYGFDDALYTAARLLEVLMNAKAKPSDTFAEMPEGISTPELRIDLPESAHKPFMAELQEKIKFEGAEIIDIDGYRVEFSDGWGLIRPSNTTPCLVLRFEAESEEAMERIQGEFRNVLLAINSDLQLPF